MSLLMPACGAVCAQSVTQHIGRVKSKENRTAISISEPLVQCCLPEPATKLMARADQIRRIPPASIAVAALLILVSLLFAIACARIVQPAGNGSVLQFAVGAICFYAAALAGYRIFLRFFPLRDGPVVPGENEF